MRRSCKKWDCKKRSRGQAGLTLMELLIGVALLGLVTISFGYLYATSQRFMIQSVDFSSTQGEASFALEHVQRHLQLATAVAVPANVGNFGSTLEFTWQPTIAAAARTSRYELSGTDLRFIPDTARAGIFEVIARGIDDITFTRATAASLGIEVEAERTSPGETRRATTLRTTVSPRGLF